MDDRAPPMLEYQTPSPKNHWLRASLLIAVLAIGVSLLCVSIFVAIRSQRRASVEAARVRAAAASYAAMIAAYQRSLDEARAATTRAATRASD